MLEVKTKICFIAHNRDTWHGCYNANDDWSITVYGETYEEALKYAAKACRESSIIIEYVESCKMKVIEYKGETIVLETVEEIVDDKKAKEDLINAMKELEQSA